MGGIRPIQNVSRDINSLEHGGRFLRESRLPRQSAFNDKGEIISR